APNTRLAPSHPGDNYRPAGQEIDVAGELTRFMSGNHAIVVRRIEDVDLSGFNDEEIDIGLTGAKDGFTIVVVAGRRQRFEDGELGGREPGERCFLTCG